MDRICYQYLDSPIGKLLAAGSGKELYCLSTNEEIQPCWECKETPVLRLLKEQLSEYFEGKRTAFSVPLNLQGTEFQKRVWQELLKIPYGETRTYGQIAAAVGNPKAFRAVGMANHYNPVMILVPCHRVIGSGGKLTGYAGGLKIKEWLLKREAIFF